MSNCHPIPSAQAYVLVTDEQILNFFGKRVTEQMFLYDFIV